MVSREQASDDFLLKISEVFGLDLAGRVVQAIRYCDQLAGNFYRESSRSRKFRFRKSLKSGKHMLTHGCGEGSDEAGVERVHRKVVYSVVAMVRIVWALRDIGLNFALRFAARGPSAEWNNFFFSSGHFRARLQIVASLRDCDR